jgi:enoyl-CoA hydratase
MAFAAKFASQPPASAAKTKLTINRLTHALDDLTSHMDIDQFALATLTEDHKEGVAAFLWSGASRVSGDAETSPDRSRQSRPPYP